MESENQEVPSANQGMLGTKHQQKAMAGEGHSSVAVHLLSMHRVVSSVCSRVWLHTHTGQDSESGEGGGMVMNSRLVLLIAL